MRVGGKKTKPAATREEVYALAAAMRDMGEPHLGAAALICFEWLQRPENVLTGKLTWSDYRGPEHPKHVRILHHKTGEEVLQPLEVEGTLLYPELEGYLQDLPRLGFPIVVTTGSRGPSRPYAMVYAQARVRRARVAAGLGEHVTLDACRHGGMTELGDAELVEQGVMALSGHKTPQAARLYMKRTEAQRIAAARKRRSWVEKKRASVMSRTKQGRSGNEGRLTEWKWNKPIEENPLGSKRSPTESNPSFQIENLTSLARSAPLARAFAGIRVVPITDRPCRSLRS